MPLSMRGMSAARHILFTWLRAAEERRRSVLVPPFRQKRTFWSQSSLNTSVIQRVHHQHKLFKELHVVVGAVGEETRGLFNIPDR